MDFPEISKDTVTLIIAIWGAIIGTFGGVPQIVSVWRDRARIKITVERGMPGRFAPYGEIILLYGVPIDKQHPELYRYSYCVVTITNTGRRKIRVAEMGTEGFKLSSYNSKRMSNIGHWPTMLQRLQEKNYFENAFLLSEENPSKEFWIYEDTIPFEHIKYFWVRDAAGRTYRKRYHWLPYFFRYPSRLPDFFSNGSEHPKNDPVDEPKNLYNSTAG